jgi:hypothetical protein
VLHYVKINVLSHVVQVYMLLDRSIIYGCLYKKNMYMSQSSKGMQGSIPKGTTRSNDI